QLHETPGHDLPGHTELVRDPAALQRRSSSSHESVPVPIHLLLVLAINVEREPLGEAEVRAAVITHEGLAPHHELCRGDGAIVSGASDVPYLGIGEGRGIKRYGVCELIV